MARSKFTRSQLQAAALKIVDERGLTALSMRALASALGTGPMTIYNYFQDRDDLDALLVEAVMAKAQIPKTGHADWRVDVRAVLEAVWRAVHAHPNAIPLILTCRVTHQTTLEIAEILLEALARSGRSDADLLAAFRTLNGFVMGLAQAQLVQPLFEKPETVSKMNAARPVVLSNDQFPKLRNIAEIAVQTAPSREFHAGLDIILAGL